MTIRYFGRKWTNFKIFEFGDIWLELRKYYQIAQEISCQTESDAGENFQTLFLISRKIWWKEF